MPGSFCCKENDVSRRLVALRKSRNPNVAPTFFVGAYSKVYGFFLLLSVYCEVRLCCKYFYVIFSVSRVLAAGM